MGFLLNPQVLAGLGIAALIAMASSFGYGYSKGYELAGLRCNTRVQAIKDEVAERNAKIRDEAARRRAENDRLLEKRNEDAKSAARREVELRKRVEEYEADLRKRPDACPLTEEDVRQLR